MCEDEEKTNASSSTLVYKEFKSLPAVKVSLNDDVLLFSSFDNFKYCSWHKYVSIEIRIIIINGYCFVNDICFD
jgi:hypothetical protein